MLSIKISNQTKSDIERTQAKLLLEKHIKVSQSDIISKIIQNTIHNETLIEQLFSSDPVSPTPQKKLFNIIINERKKPIIRLFPEEWDD